MSFSRPEHSARWRAFAFLVVGLAVGLTAQWRLSLGRVDWLAGLLYFAAGALAVLGARTGASDRNGAPSKAAEPPARTGPSLPAWILVLLGAGLLVFAGMRVFGQWDAVREVWPAYPVGFLLCLAGFALWDRYRPLRVLALMRRHKMESLAVLGLVALSFIVHLAALRDYPPAGGISWNDEAQMGKDAYQFLQGRSLPWQYPTSVYPVALSFALFRPSTFSLRLPFAVMGALAVVPLYFLGRRLLGTVPAFTAALLFTTSRFWLAFTRLVLPLTPDVLCALVALACLARAVRTGGKAAYFLAGAALALGMPSHASFKLALVFALLFLALAALRGVWGRRWQAVRKSLRGHLPGLLFFVLSFLTFSAPY